MNKNEEMPGEFKSSENAKLVDGNFIKVNTAIFC